MLGQLSSRCARRNGAAFALSRGRFVDGGAEAKGKGYGGEVSQN